MVVEVGYAQAWDLETRMPWRPMSVREARERDATGLPYVVVYRTADREAPLEVRLVSWRDHYVGLWIYDALGRRTYELDLRLLDDPARLLCRYADAWHYTGPEMTEFDKACPRTTVELFPDGKGQREEQPRGEAGGATVTVPRVGDERWTNRPAFGEWPLLSAQFHGLTEPPVFEITEPAEATDQADKPAPDAPDACWRPPLPAQPGPISELFRPGTRVTDRYHPEMTIVEPRRIGSLRVPSGLLAVSGPDIDHGDGPHITVPVPPGEYVLEEAPASLHAHRYEWEARDVTRICWCL
ncbi:hypothetical protein ACFV6E_08085 [Streptomyces sp. NPDC059785]|uniref:hypothetical protein n=1 Tax=unclassified Streptomyces TaxID=2593676 RepID=UPI00365A7253